ncbi:TetR/AcrR family transcriptional regulator [Nocardioides pacificus]
MPRNRRPQDREEKRAEIVDAAAGLFTQAGYDNTSMARVAASAGVTTNTIYWYFKDKDALLVGVLDHLLSESLAAASLHAGEPWVDQVLWAVEQLDQYNRLVTDVHARASASPAIEAWHKSFHDLMDSLMARGFRGVGVAEADLDAMNRIGAFVVEGLLMHPHTGPSRREIVEQLVRPRGDRSA